MNNTYFSYEEIFIDGHFLLEDNIQGICSGIIEEDNFKGFREIYFRSEELRHLSYGF